jgi:DNA-binding CsgD family transcriptional regulator
VKNHLRRIYDKLDINSRVELAVHGAGVERR